MVGRRYTVQDLGTGSHSMEVISMTFCLRCLHLWQANDTLSLRVVLNGRIKSCSSWGIAVPEAGGEAELLSISMFWFGPREGANKPRKDDPLPEALKSTSDADTGTRNGWILVSFIRFVHSWRCLRTFVPRLEFPGELRC